VRAIGGINREYDGIAPYLGQAGHSSRNRGFLDRQLKPRLTESRCFESGQKAKFRRPVLAIWQCCQACVTLQIAQRAQKRRQASKLDVTPIPIF
jgi:hypothetical protein